MPPTFLFIMDMLMQMWEGNLVAWMAFIFLILAVACVVILLVAYWKLPQPAKKMFWNNLFHHNPVVFDAYDNRKLRVETPQIFREGILHDKDSGWHFVPRPTTEMSDTLSVSEREIINKTFTLDGASGQAYLAYSGKGLIVNPELQTFLENSKALLPKHSNVDGKQPQSPIEVKRRVQVPKQAWIDALTRVKGKFVSVDVYITWLLDPRRIKDMIDTAWMESQLVAMEVDIRKDAMAEAQGGTLIKVTLLLVVVGLVMVGVGLAKLFNAI